MGWGFPGLEFWVFQIRSRLIQTFDGKPRNCYCLLNIADFHSVFFYFPRPEDSLC